MIDYDIQNDIEHIAAKLELTKNVFAMWLDIDYSTMYRWIKNNKITDNNKLSYIYETAYLNKVRLNSAYTQFFKEDYSKTNEHILFHGSKYGIENKLTIENSKPNNDFGKGFYLGESFSQSGTFIQNYKDSSIYIMLFTDNKLKKLKYKVDKEWMLTIAYFRGYLDEYKDHKIIKDLIKKINDIDYIIAPIADNNMFEIIEDFVNGNITDSQCLHALSATDLGYQYIMKTQKALNNLTPLRKCFLTSYERNEFKNISLNRIIESDEKIRIAKQKYNGQGKFINEILK